MQEGLVVKLYGGFYYVLAEDKILTCRARGRLRQTGVQVLVGDRVLVANSAPDEGVIEEILPRRNFLPRPPVANVDQVNIVLAARQPNPNTKLLDRLLVLTEWQRVEPVLCLNKIDLTDEGKIAEMVRVYRAAGYKVFSTSVKSGAGLEDLARAMVGKVSVFAGPSGVGKSSLLNALAPAHFIAVGEISKKIQRGRHTTRHVELVHIAGGGLVADTPGFTSLELPPINKKDLAGYFPELAKHAEGCRFNGCLHGPEPGCAVKEAVSSGTISKERYQHYLDFLVELDARPGY